MPSPYPIELRERAVSLYKSRHYIQSEVAELFKISISTLRNYLRRDAQGDLNPKAYRRGRVPEIGGDRLAQVGVWVNEKPDITLKALRKLYKKHYKVNVSLSMLCRACAELDLRRKKKSLFAQEQERVDIKKKTGVSK